MYNDTQTKWKLKEKNNKLHPSHTSMYFNYLNIGMKEIRREYSEKVTFRLFWSLPNNLLDKR